MMIFEALAVLWLAAFAGFIAYHEWWFWRRDRKFGRLMDRVERKARPKTREMENGDV